MVAEPAEEELAGLRGVAEALAHGAEGEAFVGGGQKLGLDGIQGAVEHRDTIAPDEDDTRGAAWHSRHDVEGEGAPGRHHRLIHGAQSVRPHETNRQLGEAGRTACLNRRQVEHRLVDGVEDVVAGPLEAGQVDHPAGAVGGKERRERRAPVAQGRRKRWMDGEVPVGQGGERRLAHEPVSKRIAGRERGAQSQAVYVGVHAQAAGRGETTVADDQVLENAGAVPEGGLDSVRGRDDVEEGELGGAQVKHGAVSWG